MRRSFIAGIARIFTAVGICASIVDVDISLASIILFLFPFPIALIAHFRGESPIAAMIIGLMVLTTIGLALVPGIEFNSLDTRGILRVLSACRR